MPEGFIQIYRFEWNPSGAAASFLYLQDFGVLVTEADARI